ncbi:MAG: hypothetical protein E7310_08950 [Clostridiales bacterium]|nr:hypothetical protein [Clostridiales bacterium]
MDNLNNKQKIILTIITIIIIFIIGIFLITKDKNVENEYQQYIVDENEKVQEKEKIKIHVIGEVQNSGIVELEEGARISDIIEAAGGSTENADLSKVNLAYEVEDGQKVYIPSINDERVEQYVTNGSGEGIIEEETKKGLVNINTATQTELETLPGIGPSTALKIITYREENGKFKKAEDIQNVPGIGGAKFENIKDSITVK